MSLECHLNLIHFQIDVAVVAQRLPEMMNELMLLSPIVDCCADVLQYLTDLQHQLNFSVAVILFLGILRMLGLNCPYCSCLKKIK